MSFLQEAVALSVVLLAFLIQALPMTPQGTAIVAFDCHDPTSQLWTVSLLKTPACETPEDPDQARTIDIQLVQRSRYRSVRYMQCFVKRTVFIKGCGKLYDYTWELKNNYDDSILDIPDHACREMHRTGHYDLWGMKIDKLIYNGTVKDYRMATGALNEDGDCSAGEKYTLNGKSFEGVIAQEHYEVGLFDGTALVDLDANEIHLPSGIRAKFDKGSAMDIMRGFTTWDTHEEECIKSKYDVLYQGPAKQVIGTFQGKKRVVITVEQATTTFALELKSRTLVCSVEVHETEHPQLFIYEAEHSSYVFPKRQLIPQNVDFSAYVNTKFVYVEKHIRGQITSLYKDLMMQKCKVERLALNNLLTTALVSEDEFAYTYMEDAGYTAMVRGEVAHVVKCAPVPVYLIQTERCYKEVPVKYQNETYYLSPRNRLLQRAGTEIECHPLLPVMFLFDKDWFSVFPKPIRVPNPNILKPKSEQTFEYQSPANLASSGLYSKEDLDAYQKAVIFSGETAAVGRSMSRAFMGQEIDLTHRHGENLLGTAAEDMLSTKIIGKIWGWASWFGSSVAAIIGFWFLWKTMIMILNFVMNCYSLHSEFGPSKYMIAAFLDSMTTHLLVNRGLRKKSRPSPASPSPDGFDEEKSQLKDERGFESIPLAEAGTPSAPSADTPFLYPWRLVSKTPNTLPPI